MTGDQYIRVQSEEVGVEVRMGVESLSGRKNVERHDHPPKKRRDQVESNSNIREFSRLKPSLRFKVGAWTPSKKRQRRSHNFGFEGIQWFCYLFPTPF